MAISESKGSATISTTEYSLPAAANYSSGSPQTTACIVQAFVDATAMAAGDQYRLRIYERLNAGTQRVVYEAVLTGVQGGIFAFPALVLLDGWDVTALKNSGTDRSIVWSVRKVT